MVQHAKADGWRVNYTKNQYRYECPGCVATAGARLKKTLEDAELGERKFVPTPAKKKKKKPKSK